MPWLDELGQLGLDGPAPEHFYRIQSLLFAVLDVHLSPSQLGRVFVDA